LAYATYHDFKLYQMDVKSSFLNGRLSELVYVEQPLGFKVPKHPNQVYKLHKTVYGLKQAPRAWYECLKDFFLKKSFEIGKPILLSLLTKSIKIFFCAKYMLMTLYLAQLIKNFVTNLVGS
jgi:hypothetical protein